ncbi:MAG: cytochrome P450 [Rhizorhabdus sp.]
MQSDSTTPMTTPEGLESYHPLDPVGAFDLYPKLARFRRECPVFRTLRPDYPPVTFFTRYADIVTILRDPDAFQSMGTNVTLEDYEQIPVEERYHIELNGAEHAEVRRLLLSAVSPVAIKRVIPLIEALGKQIVDGFLASGQADMVADWAALMPGMATAFVMGFPMEDGPKIHQWVHAQLDDDALKQAEADKKQLRGNEMAPHFGDYLVEQIAMRRDGRITAEDGLTQILRYQPRRGYPFTDRELVLHVHSLLVAANETTTSFMANALRRILQTPGLYRQLRTDRSLIEPFLREVARIDPPLVLLTRCCTRPTTVAGENLQPGEVVILSLASANHAETVWGVDADEFRPDRFNAIVDKDVMTFGIGVHFCPGSHLAKLEATIALNAMFDQIEDMRLGPDARLEKVWYYLIDRPKRIDVEFAV